ncbi:MAG TPA: helicase C-terminal domain-containing protein, partial [Sedimentisphaerales bacterium]|nr:helicase C-terminal domain-containing protein [Sedimentisphaerales bacterium]
STFTITLQEQLINKDLPFLAAALPLPFDAVLAKGRSNYLCARRLDFTRRRMSGMFDAFQSELDALLEWAAVTSDGSLSDIARQPSSALWDAVKSEHGNCRGRGCPHYTGCFYARARRRWETADIIVANHALLVSDLVLRKKGHGMLPEYKCVIIDEAHNIEHVAEDQFGIDIASTAVEFTLNALYNPRTRKGLLAFSDRAKTVVDLVADCHEQTRSFFRKVARWYEDEGRTSGGRCGPGFVKDDLSQKLKNLGLALLKLSQDTDEEDEKFEYDRSVQRLAGLQDELETFMAASRQDCVYWVEAEKNARAKVALRCAPLNVGPYLKECLFDECDSVILTSATLSSDDSDAKRGFDFFATRVGLEDYDGLKLGSPFDYRRQVTVYIEKDLPQPNEPAFEDAAVAAIKKYIDMTGGSAFVLFTSYAALDAVASRMDNWLASRNIRLLQQGAGTHRSELLRQFREDKTSVLFGADSFWQGVDVPGESLSNVIIVRLPFAVPNHPLVQGRIEQIREQGGNPFYEFQIPSAVIKFKQGFGRLIRTRTDKGIVVILDSRIVKKPYGKRFLRAIPPCEIVKVDGAWLTASR